jgi:hypothetical protein
MPPELLQQGDSESTVKVLNFPEERAPVAPSRRAPSPDDTATVSAIGGRLDLLEPLNRDELALLIEGDPVPLIVRVGGSVVVGRYSENNLEQPHIDLVPYGAFEKGVSRFHAMLHRHDERVFIEDLASSNGTWLNGKRLEARRTHPVRSGDYLRFGQLRVQVHFKPAPVKA